MKIVARDIPPRSAWALEQAGVHPLLARLYAARGVRAKDELDDGLARLLPPDTPARRARGRRAAGRCDRATTSASASWPTTTATAPPPARSRVRGLRLLGAQHVSYLVPDRVIDGYGLTPPIVERVARAAAPTC